MTCKHRPPRESPSAPATQYRSRERSRRQDRLQQWPLSQGLPAVNHPRHPQHLQLWTERQQHHLDSHGRWKQGQTRPPQRLLRGWDWMTFHCSELPGADVQGTGHQGLSPRQHIRLVIHACRTCPLRRISSDTGRSIGYMRSPLSLLSRLLRPKSPLAEPRQPRRPGKACRHEPLKRSHLGTISSPMPVFKLPPASKRNCHQHLRSGGPLLMNGLASMLE